MSKIVSLLLQQQRPIYIISPHFDDAVLSCGELISQLSLRTPITVVNVFTKAHGGPYTWSAKKFLRASGFQDAQKLFRSREKEDKQALSSLKVKIINLGLTDALFRQSGVSTLWNFIPELNHLYPTYRWHILKKINARDTALEQVKAMLAEILPQNAQVFTPLNLARHVDHGIVRKACEAVSSHLFYYSEFPYSYRQGTYGSQTESVRYEVPVDIQAKRSLISQYQTQVAGLFPDGTIPQHVEVFFKRNI